MRATTKVALIAAAALIGWVAAWRSAGGGLEGYYRAGIHGAVIGSIAGILVVLLLTRPGRPNRAR